MIIISKEMVNLNINEDLQKFIPALQEAEKEDLFNSVKANGVQIPIIITPDGTIVDGHNRFHASKEAGLTHIPTTCKEFDSEDDIKIFMLNNQLGRRNLTNFQRIELALAREELIVAASTSKGEAGSIDNKTNQKVAEAAGVGRDSVRKAKNIIESKDEELIEKVRNNEISIHQAEQQAKLYSDIPKVVADPDATTFYLNTPLAGHGAAKFDKLWKLCGNDDLRPVLKHIYFDNGFAIATDSHVFGKVHLSCFVAEELITDEVLEILQGKFLSVESAKVMSRQEIFKVSHKGFHTSEGMLIPFTDVDAPYPNYNAVVDKVWVSGCEAAIFGMNPKNLNRVMDVALSLDNHMDKVIIRTTASNKGALVFNPYVGPEKAIFMAMPHSINEEEVEMFSGANQPTK